MEETAKASLSTQIAQVTQAKPMGSIEGAITDQESLLSELHAQIEHLENKLDTVIGAGGKDDSVGSDTPSHPVPLTNRLIVHNNLLARANRHISNLIERVEL